MPKMTTNLLYNKKKFLTKPQLQEKFLISLTSIDLNKEPQFQITFKEIQI